MSTPKSTGISGRVKGIFTAMQSVASIGGWEVDLLTENVYWTEEMYRIYDTAMDQYKPTYASTRELSVNNHYVSLLEDAFKKALNGETFDQECEQLTLKGRRIWIRNYGRPVMEDGRPIKIVGATQDITKQKLAEIEVFRQSNFDYLTELPNRRMFRYCLEKEMLKATRLDSMLALMFIDLDHFKEINDTFGHDCGDELIKVAASRLKKCVRGADVVARLGGDEFTIIISGLAHFDAAGRIACTILQSLSEPFTVGGELAYLTASIGITLYPCDGSEADLLVKNADQAMYMAKKDGRNQYHYYTDEMNSAALARAIIASSLPMALKKKEFFLVYQPIIDFSTGKVCKAEALIRWHHPSQGLMNPAEFIRVAEENGFITEIGEWVFHEAALQVKEWQSSCGDDFKISINTSPLQYRDRNNRIGDWTEHLTQLGLTGDAIIAEITESVLMDSHSEIVEKLKTLRLEGIKLSLDDFGTGYSSLSYLRKFDIDYLKIDQSFVRNMHTDSRDIALCEAIIAMAHKLGIKVVAEGIETEEQRSLLVNAGCDYGQGYFFSKPVLPDEFEALLVGY